MKPRRQTLVLQAVQRLRKDFLRQAENGKELLPSEGELALRLGVSRTVLREAMKQLQAQGLVHVSQGRRPRIRAADARPTIESLDTLLRRTNGSLLHLVEARRPLEGEIAALAAERARPEDVEAAAKALHDLESAATLDARVEADVRFHRVLAEATRNPVLTLILDTVAGLLRASRYRSIGEHGVRPAAEGHREILEALRRRDPASARDAMRRHLAWNEEHLRGNAPW
jgi:GntR family transcriptional repressor for pyruvate dehydrogenase complex